MTNTIESECRYNQVSHQSHNLYVLPFELGNEMMQHMVPRAGRDKGNINPVRYPRSPDGWLCAAQPLEQISCQTGVKPRDKQEVFYNGLKRGAPATCTPPAESML